MTREEAIVILDGFKHNPLFNEQHFEALDMAILALSENKGEWIPVSERLPLFFNTYKVTDDVLITNGYDNYMGYIVERKGKNFWHYYDSDIEVGIGDNDDDVTAWMPLPEPYKAERGE